MPKVPDSAITKLLRLADSLTPEERQAGIDILRHYRQIDRKGPAKPSGQKKRAQKPSSTAGETS